MKKKFNKLNEHLKKIFGERTLKICIDAGFTCPNRDGTKGFGGCIFCSEKGSGELIKCSGDISSSVKQYLSSYRGLRANKFIVYFQNFSNTYADIETLKNIYDSALIDDRIVGLSIATRPDCIDENIAKLLASYMPKYHVCVELGLQNADDKIGNIINRCYSTQDFIDACSILKKYNIEIIAHIMIGLPNENNKSIDDTIALINNLAVDGIKLHCTYIVLGTKLNSLYNTKKYDPVSMEYYIEKVIYILERLNPKIVIHRLMSDAPKDILVAPEWNKHKKLVLNSIEKQLKTLDTFQGKFFANKNT